MMRDAIVVAYFIVLLLLSLGRPNLSLALWIWTAFATPTALVYGFGDSIRFNLVAAVLTILTCAVVRRPETPVSPNISIKFATSFFVWSFVTSIAAIHDTKALGLVQSDFVKCMALFFYTLWIVRHHKHFTLIAWVVILALGLYSGIEGLKFIASGGGHKISGPSGSNLTDNNHLALGINMMLPFAFFLIKESKFLWLRCALIAFALVSILAVVGTQSRGGFAGLAAMLFVWAMLGQRKWLLIPSMMLVGAVLVTFIPDQYFDRVSTIKTAQDQGSFESRVIAWKQSTLIAMDNPITGGGFHAVQTFDVWQYYALQFDKLDFIPTEHASIYPYKAAHSIYFQVLGDHGFIGFAFFILTFISAGLVALRLSRFNRHAKDQRWINSFALSCFLSLVAYAVSGALVSLAYFEFAWLIVALLSSLAACSARLVTPSEIGRSVSSLK